jgi:hypothetical protein
MKEKIEHFLNHGDHHGEICLIPGLYLSFNFDGDLVLADSRTSVILAPEESNADCIAKMVGDIGRVWGLF